MHIESNHVAVIVDQLRAALAGEPLPDPNGPDMRALLDALRALLAGADPGVPGGAFHMVALAALAGLNARARVAVTSAKALDTARRH